MRAAEHRTEAGSSVAASVYPLMLDGESLEALVVGGGEVAARKAQALLAAGARVRLIAAGVGDACRALRVDPRITIEERELSPDAIEGAIGDATLVIAATDAPELNARIAGEARRLRRLVNVVDAPESGNCVTPAIHRAGALTVAITTGGVPGAAVRIRDAIAERFDARYAAALATLSGVRDRLLRGGGRAEWRRAADSLLDADFCETVERGTFAERAAPWR